MFGFDPNKKNKHNDTFFKYAEIRKKVFYQNNKEQGIKKSILRGKTFIQ